MTRRCTQHTGRELPATPAGDPSFLAARRWVASLGLEAKAPEAVGAAARPVPPLLMRNRTTGVSFRDQRGRQVSAASGSSQSRQHGHEVRKPWGRPRPAATGGGCEKGRSLGCPQAEKRRSRDAIHCEVAHEQP